MKALERLTQRSASSGVDAAGASMVSQLVPKATIPAYYQFWHTMSATAAANSFFSALIKQLTADKSSKGIADAALGISSGTVLATLLLLVLYTPVSPDPKEIKKRLQELRSREAAGPSEALSVEAVVQMIGHAGDNSELALMVHRCSDVVTIAGLDNPAGSQSDRSNASPQIREADLARLVEGGEIASAFLFGYLLRRLQESHGTATVISTLRGILSLGPTLIPRPKALALLHMLREILRCCHQFTDEELGKLDKEVRVYRTWSQPVGASACDALRALTAELGMRGASMFHVLAREVPWLRAGTSFVRAPAARLALADAFAVHVVLDEQIDWARTFKALLMAPELRHVEEESIRLALCSMLYTLMKGAGLGVAPAKLACLSFEQVAYFAAEATTLASRLGADALHTSAGGSLSREGSALGGGGFGFAHGGGEAAEGLRALAEQIHNKSQRRQTEAVGGSDVRAPRLPPLTLRSLERILGGTQHANAELREAAEQCGGRRYLYDPMLAALHERLKERASSGEPADASPPLRLCVAGGDGSLHRLIQAYIVLRSAYPRMCSADTVRFYLVPIGASKTHSHKLASFLASQDGWYRRHVFAPHYAGAPTVPHLITSHANSSAASPGYLESHDSAAYDLTDADGMGAHDGAGGPEHSAPFLPAAPLRSCLCDYLRSATAALPLKLFEVACWLTPPMSAGSSSGFLSPDAPSSSSKRPAEPPFITIAFGQSVEVVGSNGTSQREASAEAGGVNVCVSYTMSDPWGVSYPTPTTIAARFNSLSMHTHSIDPFHSPSSGRLQLRCSLSATSSAKASRSPLRYVKTATVSAGRDLAGADSTTPRLQTRPGSAGMERFGLLVDGEYYGPFAYVHISQCVVPGSSEAISLPLMSFFPIGDGDDGTIMG